MLMNIVATLFHTVMIYTTIQKLGKDINIIMQQAHCIDQKQK